MNRQRRAQRPPAETWEDREVNVVIRGDLRQRLKSYLGGHDKLKQKDVFNEALDEYLKKRGAKPSAG